jgi:glycosyltransferase involved in cell wall biosynthesis
MKFSVVITTYNRVNLLRRAIDCSLNQTVPCEVVVADDCSSDDTEAYVNSLGDRVIYHRNEINKGHAATVNAGVEKASGDWIKFLDDDDYLAPNCLEEMAKAIALRPDAAICSCIAAQVNSDEVELSLTRQVGEGLAFYIPQADIHYAMLLELLPFGTPVQVASSRQAFLKSGGWDVNLTSCDDIDAWIRISQFGDAIFINQCLAYRTLWSGGYDQKISLEERMDTNILMKEKIYSLVDEQHRDAIPRFRDIRNYIQLHWTFVALKQKNLQSILSMAKPSVLSPAAWRILLTAVFSRCSTKKTIRKIVLID